MLVILNKIHKNPVNIPDSGLKITFAEDGTANVGGTAVTVSGEKPSGGSVTIKTNGTITCDGLQFTSGGSYSCTTEDGNTMTCEAN